MYLTLIRLFIMVKHQVNFIPPFHFSYFNKTKRSKSKKGIDANSGVNYLTFSFKSLAPVLERIENAGIDIVGDVEREGYRIIFIQDPDGIYIELIERN